MAKARRAPSAPKNATIRFEASGRRGGYWNIFFGDLDVTWANDKAHAARIVAALNADEVAVALAVELNLFADGEKLKVRHGVLAAMRQEKAGGVDNVSAAAATSYVLWDKARAIRTLCE